MKNEFISWYMYTARLLGVPILAVLIVLGAQKGLFTFTCASVGWKCESSMGASDALADYMGGMLAANPGQDIVVKPRKGK
jgi:hypothetical protein